MRFFTQLLRLMHIACANVLKRRWVSMTVSLSVALVVLVLIGFLGLSAGFERALKNTGSEDIAILLSEQATSEVSSNVDRTQVELIRQFPGIRKQNDEELVSSEIVVVSGGRNRRDATRLNITLRGMFRDQGNAMRRGFKLVQGRWFETGANELLVGRQMIEEVDGFELGAKVRIKGRDWIIVGVFALEGNLFEGEAWADARAVQSSYNRQAQFNSVRVALTSADQLFDLTKFVSTDPRIDLEVQSEKDFFSRQSEGMVNLIGYVGWPLAIVLSAGAFFGTLNAMLISIQSRRRELAILRQLGFSSVAIFLSIMTESVLCAAAGAAIGLGIALLFLDGFATSTLAGDFRSVTYALDVTNGVGWQAFLLALAIGVLAGIVPAARSVRGSMLV